MAMVWEPVRQCRKCGLVYRGDEVRAMFTNDSGLYISRTCNACRQTAKDERKGRDRFTIKARSSLGHHARKYGMTPAEFSDRHGWVVPHMSHDLEHAHTNGCPYCRRPFASMAHGLADMTFDIIDPRRPPDYATNVRVCCLTCNREKQRTAPELWETKRRAWRRWETRPILDDGRLFDPDA